MMGEREGATTGDIGSREDRLESLAEIPSSDHQDNLLPLDEVHLQTSIIPIYSHLAHL